MTTATESLGQAASSGGLGALSSRYAIFRRRGQLFGMGVELVREVLPGQPLTHVPRAGEQIVGVLSLRGEILPVVIIDKWLGLPSLPDDPSQPILVLRRGDLLVGVRADAVQGVSVALPADIQPHPAMGQQKHLAGIWRSEGHAPVTLLDGNILLEALCPQKS